MGNGVRIYIKHNWRTSLCFCQHPADTCYCRCTCLALWTVNVRKVKQHVEISLYWLIGKKKLRRKGSSTGWFGGVRPGMYLLASTLELTALCFGKSTFSQFILYPVCYSYLCIGDRSYLWHHKLICWWAYSNILLYFIFLFDELANHHRPKRWIVQLTRKHNSQLSLAGHGG